jgi:orotate phosphoribosyltransferase
MGRPPVEALKTWIREHGVVRAPEGETFTFVSGKQATTYVDMRRVLLASAEYLDMFATKICQEIEPTIGLIGAVPTGGLILLGPVLMLLRAFGNDSNIEHAGFYVRSSAKLHGLARQIEGANIEASRCCLIEDTVSTGGSVCEAIRAVSEAGGAVAQVICCLDRGLGGREAIEALGARFTALVRYDELGIEA